MKITKGMGRLLYEGNIEKIRTILERRQINWGHDTHKLTNGTEQVGWELRCNRSHNKRTRDRQLN